ncbi:MAG TPA: hypothetical protein VF796_29030 [Humisphaera sp.]
MSNFPPPLPPQPLQYSPPPTARPPGMFAPCPRCGCPYADRVTFTWWGGLLGPKLFTHVKCRNCRQAYNGKTGRDNTTAITIYVVVSLGIGLAVAAVMIVGVLLGN